MKKLTPIPVITSTLILSFFATATAAQPVHVPFRVVPSSLASGVHRVSVGSEYTRAAAFQKLLRVPDAPWLRLRFSDYDLGQNSYVVLTSLEDGSQQFLNSRSILEWQGSSAYFNGDALLVELYVAPGDSGVFIRSDDLIAGRRDDVGKEQTVEASSLCDGDDDRISSSTPSVGRIVASSFAELQHCTGWITSNGSFLSAGHCFGSDFNVVEFNVPPSDRDGTINHPPAEDQYPITDVEDYTDGGVGNDWLVFAVGRNSNTNQLPVQEQDDFFRLSRDSGPATVRITGYGLDGSPPDQYNSILRRYLNSDSGTQQTDSGSNIGETLEGPSDVYWRYRVDTEGGDSGAPIIDDVSGLTIGIHTNGGCTASGGNNYGTSFENNALEYAIQNFPGQNVQYADNGHPIALEDGTVFRPYDTVNEALSNVTTGGIVSIVKGSYGETISIDRAMTLEAPVGVVRIGGSTSPYYARGANSLQARSKGHLGDESGSPQSEFGLSQNYPNPFSQTTTIRYTLGERTEVSIKIYNILGQHIRTVVEGAKPSGAHSVVWDGKDGSGLLVPSGLYFYQIVAGDFRQAHNMVLLK